MTRQRRTPSRPNRQIDTDALRKRRTPRAAGIHEHVSGDFSPIRQLDMGNPVSMRTVAHRFTRDEMNARFACTVSEPLHDAVTVKPALACQTFNTIGQIADLHPRVAALQRLRGMFLQLHPERSGERAPPAQHVLLLRVANEQVSAIHQIDTSTVPRFLPFAGGKEFVTELR